MSFDWSILHWIQNTLACPLLDLLMPKLTLLGNGGAIWLLAAGGLLHEKIPQTGRPPACGTCRRRAGGQRMPEKPYRPPAPLLAGRKRAAAGWTKACGC